MAGGLFSVPNLSDPGTDMQLAGQGLLELGTETANPFIFLTGAVVEALSVIPQLISAFSGVPKNQKTVETGQRLLQSINPAVQLLGAWWYKAGQLGIVDSSAPDIAQYFKPAFDFTIQTLGIPYASPAWYALSQVIGEGQPASIFDTAYKAANLPVPMFVPSQAFAIQNPQDRYPGELVNLYTAYIPAFVTSPGPQPPPSSGNGGQTPRVPITGSQNGSDVSAIQGCCQSLLNGLTLIASAVGDLTQEQGLAQMPGILAVLQQIASAVTNLAQLITGLSQSLGAGASGLVGALVNVTNAIDQTVINTAGEEVGALNAVAQAIVTALGKIDSDSENSLAGITKAVAAIPPVDFGPLEKLLSCLCADPGSVNSFVQDLIDQGLVNSDLATLWLSQPVQ